MNKNAGINSFFRKKFNKNRKSISSSLIVTITTVVLIFAVMIVITTLISRDMSKYSILLNDTGRIRGGIQRIVKLEIAGHNSGELVKNIDILLEKTVRIEKSRFFKFRNNREYKDTIALLARRWTALRETLAEYQKEKHTEAKLLTESEELWEIADKAVSSLEETSHYNVYLYYLFSLIGGFGIIMLLIAILVTKVFVRDKIEFMADHDQLTGIYNRHYFQKFFERELLLSERTGNPFALMMCDIDHFKKINDTYGHDKGDLVLKKAAELIMQTSRKSDLAARFGGEEFVILSTGDSLSGYAGHAERIRRTIEECVFPGGIRITISIGIATYRKGMDGPEIFKKADNALYSAKENGRNRVVAAETD